MCNLNNKLKRLHKLSTWPISLGGFFQSGRSTFERCIRRGIIYPVGEPHLISTDGYLLARRLV